MRCEMELRDEGGVSRQKSDPSVACCEERDTPVGMTAFD